ncbi:glycosyltransferase [Patulibacter defluvii]|uniref:glycosyltransferase n=1 Tax=Patulibacter defluvii TaxID=3095358 RepID=UPI002A74E40E|nr:glycosyltransferase [Patulibacter sp. DM4]
MRICLVSRELYPFVGGGIAPIVAATARQLADVAEVVVVTSADHEAEYRRLRAAGDPRVLPDTVRMLFVEEPAETHGAFYNHMHAYSARVHAVLRAHYGGRGPDVLEFPDYLGEGFVTIQARHTRAAWLAETLVCVRLHTTAELCAVLDGHLADDFPSVSLLDAERYCLRHADRLLWSGGDVLAAYQRYYGPEALAPAIELPDGFLDEVAVEPGRSGGPLPDGPVRFLYLGRAERRKGIHDFLRGMLDSGREDWTLTIVGGDTDTGPLETSLGEQLRLTAADDPRVRFGEPVPRAEVGRFIQQHDVLVVPSRWECWPNVAREALQHNRPVLGSPVGGLTAMAIPGRSGWQAEATGRDALREAAERLLDDRDQITELIAAGGPRAVFDELTDPDALRRRYLELEGERDRRGPLGPVDVLAGGEPPLVSVVVPYFRLERYVAATLDSVAAQTYPRIETIVVNDGSLRDADLEAMAEAAAREGVVVVTQANSGLGAARNFGISQAAGRYVLPLDADDVLEPTFVARMVEILESDPKLAYVGGWSQFTDDAGDDIGDDLGGYMPYGNWSRLIERNNVGGVCSCLFRREIFASGLDYDDELTSYEDWLLFQEMADRGWWGAIVPERLFRYRIRERSMIREIGAPLLERLLGELRARREERRMRWTAGLGAARPARTAQPVPDTEPDPEAALRALRAANAQLAQPGASRSAAAGHRLHAASAARAAAETTVARA